MNRLGQEHFTHLMSRSDCRNSAWEIWDLEDGDDERFDLIKGTVCVLTERQGEEIRVCELTKAGEAAYQENKRASR